MWRVSIRVDGGDGLIRKGDLQDVLAQEGKHSFERHTVCSDVSLKPVSVAVLVVTAPVWGQSKSSRSWFRSDAQGEELFMRGGEITSLRMTAIGGRRRKQNGTEHEGDR